MTNSQRRDKEMAYIAGTQVFREMAECKRKLKKLNEIDRRNLYKNEPIDDEAWQAITSQSTTD